MTPKKKKKSNEMLFIEKFVDFLLQKQTDLDQAYSTAINETLDKVVVQSCLHKKLYNEEIFRFIHNQKHKFRIKI